MWKLKLANQVRRKTAFEKRYKLYEHISKHPGLSGYELAKQLGWTSGLVDYYLKKLISDGVIENHNEVVNGRNRREYHPVKWKNLVNWDEINNFKSDDFID